MPLLALFSACATAVEPVPETWRELAMAPQITREQLERVVADTSPVLRPSPPASADVVRIVRDASGARLFRGATPLTPPYEDIESFDVSQERGEVIFSARRASGFDIGLVAIEGSEVNWVPGDPADEVAPRWAPRGHKASYILRHGSGDLVRTVHIPTAFQLVVEFPFGVVRDLAWDAPAERFAVSWETVDASQRVDVVRYGGEDRRVAIPPAVQLDVSVAPFAGGLLLQPASLSYNEKLPLVIWVVSGSLNAWDDARATILREVRSAALVVGSSPDPAVMAAVRDRRWVDQDAIFVVDPAGGTIVAGATNIVGDASVGSGRHRRSGNVVAVDPAIVKSFAARFVAERLKGISPSVHR